MADSNEKIRKNMARGEIAPYNKIDPGERMILRI